MDLPEPVSGAERSQFALLGTRRFLPFFLTQFFGAFNDNLFRNALVVSITYGAAVAADDAAVLTNLSQGLFILPFFLFSALRASWRTNTKRAGSSADAAAEVVLMILAAVALYFGHLPSLFTLIFLLGVLATVFGPLKYSLMPQHLRQSELVGRQRAGRLGHLPRHPRGTICGGLLVPTLVGRTCGRWRESRERRAAAATMVLIAGARTCARASFRAPDATDPYLKVNFNPITGDLGVIRFASGTTARFSCRCSDLVVLAGGRAGSSRKLPAYSKDVLGRRQDRVHAPARRSFRSAPRWARWPANACRATRWRSAWCRWAPSA
jgi:hypothetical protein